MRAAIAARRSGSHRLLASATRLLAGGALLASGCGVSGGVGVAPDAGSGKAPTAATDADGDYLPDWWETAFGLDPNDDGSIDPDNGTFGDPDADLWSNCAEYSEKTDPRDSAPTDTDGDGMPDAFEILHRTSTDPMLTYGLDPDDDGTTVAEHGASGDADGDAYSNHDEYLAGSDPTAGWDVSYDDLISGCPLARLNPRERRSSFRRRPWRSRWPAWGAGGVRRHRDAMDVTLCLTRACNLACTYCYAGRYRAGARSVSTSST